MKRNFTLKKRIKCINSRRKHIGGFHQSLVTCIQQKYKRLIHQDTDQTASLLQRFALHCNDKRPLYLEKGHL